jgi:predicted CXXCH cytochrome family protein
MRYGETEHWVARDRTRKRSSATFTFIVALASTATATSTAQAQQSVVGSPHDLSASGPGRIHAVEEEQVCVFCHAPHNATGQAPLWNRYERTLHYRIYESSTTEARINQPRGPSKMCLSCHDGATALGLIASRPTTSPIPMTHPTIPPGPSDLTEDLSDDHPIGFRYDRALAARDGQLKNPEVVSRELPLGRHAEVHCTTCHDPHDNRYGDFLRITDVRSTICLSCHELHGWPGSSHAVSAAATRGRSVDPRERLPYETVADNGCTSCHRIHSAESPERLLRFRREEDNCLNCHDGGVARTNVFDEFRKRSIHPVGRYLGRHDPDEDSRRMRLHVECADCHNPHAVGPSVRSLGLNAAASEVVPPPVSPATRFVSGVDRAGLPIGRARFEYEICFKCHADGISQTGFGGLVRDAGRRISRQITQTNTRLEFQTGNPSFHPVLGRRGNDEVVSLIPPLRVGSVIRCTDCHDSDSADRGGARGPHGSAYEPLLVDNYSTQDFTQESPRAYALCYRCHDRQSILGDESFPLHRSHVVGGRVPCSACHDPHGISRTQGNAVSNSHLINFDRSIVQSAGVGLSPRIEFVDLGLRRGSCTLTCHNVVHVAFEYER